MLLCLVLWMAAELAFPGFASFSHIRYMLELSALLGIVATGQTVVMITAGIDLSAGAMITFAAILDPSLTLLVGDDGWLSVPLLLAGTTAIAAANGLAVSALPIHPMIMTLAAATALTGAMLLVSGVTAVAVHSVVVVWLANGHIGGVSASILVWLVITGLTAFLLRRTVLGL